MRGWGIPHIPRGSHHLTEPLYDAGILGASAVVCAERTDLRTLETVLLIRDLRPEVRIVADLDNPAVARAVEQVLGSVGVLDVGALFAPSVVEACLGRRARDILLGDTLFVAAEVIAPRDGTLREIYGSLAPIGVVTDADDKLIACPGRDQPVAAGDRVTLLGTHEELDAAGLGFRQVRAREISDIGARARAASGRVLRTVLSVADRPLRVAAALGLVLLAISTLVLHFGYHWSGHHSHLPILDVDLLHGRDGRHGRLRRFLLLQPADLDRGVRHLPDRRRHDARDDAVRAADQRAGQPPARAVTRPRDASRACAVTS